MFARQIVGAARRTRSGRTGSEREREGCELAGVVFPQGKHEHILARGLFRQIGDCCGGERKGSSPPPPLPPPPSAPPSPPAAAAVAATVATATAAAVAATASSTTTTTTTTDTTTNAAHCHQHTAPKHSAPQTRCASYRRNEGTRHYTEIRRGCGGRATGTNDYTQAEERGQRRKWQSRERERLNGAARGLSAPFTGRE